MAHKPTDKTRGRVEAFAAYGVPQEFIAKELDISPKTLRHHYREELDHGLSKATAQVAQTLFKLAVGGDKASCMFWLKTRAGWYEKARLEHSGPDGKAIPMEGRTSRFDFDKLSPALSTELLEVALLEEASSEEEE